jgi:hypothetical protein
VDHVVVVKRRDDRDEPWRYWLTRPMAERVSSSMTRGEAASIS